jgi:hypothetical protein
LSRFGKTCRLVVRRNILFGLTATLLHLNFSPMRGNFRDKQGANNGTHRQDEFSAGLRSVCIYWRYGRGCVYLTSINKTGRNIFNQTGKNS